MKSFIAGNMKMFKLIAEAVEYAKELALAVKDVSDKEILICPPYTCLYEVSKVVKGTPIQLGAQNMMYESSGAFTGELSPEMLLDAGCQYVLLGHSERRHVFHETDDVINKKVLKALKSGLKPILCVGELLSQRKANQTKEVVLRQTKWGLEGVAKEDLKQIIIAYEPVWAIGTGETATPSQAQDAHEFIRQELSRLFGQEISSKIRILYGGSVKPDNVDDLMAQKDINGVLVGGACLEVKSFSRIIHYVEK